MASRTSRPDQRAAIRRRLLEEVEREFWDHVVHELKTPLAVLHGYATTLLDHDLPEEHRRWFLQVIAEQSLRMSQGIDLLAEVRKLEQVPSDGVADLGASVRAALRRVAKAMPDVPVAVRGGADGVPVRGSVRWLSRAIEEALLVAARGDGGVEVSVRPGTRVTVTIRAPQPVRLSGLGLYLAKRVVERFGGSLSVRPATIALRFASG